MGTADTAAALTAFERRGAGTNAERRAALWLASELRAARREAALETFWCRPNWALAHAWHAVLGVAGSLLSVTSPQVGGAVILLALVSLVADALTGISLGRRLTPERASQNVVSAAGIDSPTARLIITSNYDAGRMGLVYRSPVRRLAARLNRLSGGRAPGWQGWLALAFICVLATAIVRDSGTSSTRIDVLQLIPTAALVIAAALLLELAASPYGPSSGDNGSGMAIALAVARALDISPPRRLGIVVVLQGAGDGAMIGLSRYLRSRRGESTAANTIVLGIGASGGGHPRVWTSDGPLIPLRFDRRLRQLAARAAGPISGPQPAAPGTEPHAAGPRAELRATVHRGRGLSPAFPARFAGLPAIAIGCLDGDGLVPRSHQPTDVPEALDQSSLDRLLELALALVDAIDADLERTATDRAAASRTAA